jgi:HEPN superfamily protein
MARSLRRYVLPSDESKFVGRVYDLSIVSLHFDSYEEASKFDDAMYVIKVNSRTSLLTRRVESLNHVGDLLWPKKLISPTSLPISAYEYCNLIQDSFLMRIISVLDCCCILLASVLELGIDPKKASIANIAKLAPKNRCLKPLEELKNLQDTLRSERNTRFHRAEEERLTEDDDTFRLAARWSHWGRPLKGTDRRGKEINVDRSYKVAINRLRSKFNSNTRILIKSLNKFYRPLEGEFEQRFKERCADKGSYMRKMKAS